jgi:hypothetical protein
MAQKQAEIEIIPPKDISKTFCNAAAGGKRTTNVSDQINILKNTKKMIFKKTKKMI